MILESYISILQIEVTEILHFDNKFGDTKILQLESILSRIIEMNLGSIEVSNYGNNKTLYGNNW